MVSLSRTIWRCSHQLSLDMDSPLRGFRSRLIIVILESDQSHPHPICYPLTGPLRRLPLPIACTESSHPSPNGLLLFRPRGSTLLYLQLIGGGGSRCSPDDPHLSPGPFWPVGCGVSGMLGTYEGNSIQSERSTTF